MPPKGIQQRPKIVKKVTCPEFVGLLEWAGKLCLAKNKLAYCYLPCGHRGTADMPCEFGHSNDLEMAHRLKFGGKR